MSKSLGNTAGAAGDRGKERRGDPAPVGGVLGFHRRSAHRPGHHQGQCRSLSPSAQHHPLHAGQSFRLRARTSASSTTRCRSWSASCWRAWPSSTRSCATAYENFDFGLVNSTLFNFCTNDLSAFYFDIRKDVLYCDADRACAAAPRAPSPTRSSAASSPGSRRSSASPWKRPGRRVSAWTTACICHRFPPTPTEWANEALLKKWERVRESAPRRHRRAGAAPRGEGDRLEPGSRAGRSVSRMPPTRRCSTHVDLAEIAITSAATVEIGKDRRLSLPSCPRSRVRASPLRMARGEKCARCWMRAAEVGEHARHPSLQPLHRRASAHDACVRHQGPPPQRGSVPPTARRRPMTFRRGAGRGLPPTRAPRLSCSMASAFRALGPAARSPVLPFFNLVMVWNRGISYGLFPAGGLRWDPAS